MNNRGQGARDRPTADLPLTAPAQARTVGLVVRRRKTEKHGPTEAPELRERQALCRTRTGDPFLTMEVLYQLS
jgi:hypothetical protein